MKSAFRKVHVLLHILREDFDEILFVGDCVRHFRISEVPRILHNTHLKPGIVDPLRNVASTTVEGDIQATLSNART